jgi:ABC-type glycerol-3-phosphate transport system permease component
MSEKVYKNICTVICALFAIICLYPLLYIVALSLTSAKEYVSLSGVVYFPAMPTLDGYIKVLNAGDLILRALGISVARTLIGTALSMVIIALTAYVLSGKPFPGKKFYMYLLLFIILFSGGLIPTYLTVQDIGLMDTFWVMVIPGLLSGWNVLVFKQFFEGIPKELREAAEIDGVGVLGLFFKIVLPMSKAVLAAIGLFTVVGHWNSWFDASIYIKNNALWPLQLFTKNAFANSSELSAGALNFLVTQGDTVNTVSMQMAITVITVAPILLVYPFFQKYFTKGVYMGAVKG